MPRRLDVLSPPPLPWLATLGGTVSDTAADSHKDGGSSSNNLKPSLLVILLILIAVVLLSLFIRYLNRSCRRRSSTANSLAAAGPHQFRSLSSRRMSPEVQTLINSLPRFPFDSVPRHNPSSGVDCAVCQNNFEPHDQLCALPLCLHAFHFDCIEQAINSSVTDLDCPLCRFPIRVPDTESLLQLTSSSAAGDRIRLELGRVRRERLPSDSDSNRRSYHVGFFEYVVVEETEVVVEPMQGRPASKSGFNGKKKESVASPANIPSAAEEEAEVVVGPMQGPVDSKSSLTGKKKDSVASPENMPLAAEMAGGMGSLKQQVAGLASSASSLSLCTSARFSAEVASGAMVAPPMLVKEPPSRVITSI